MVLLTDVYRNLTSLSIKPRELAFKQFKSPVLNVLIVYAGWYVFGFSSVNFILIHPFVLTLYWIRKTYYSQIRLFNLKFSGKVNTRYKNLANLKKIICFRPFLR